ncbi:MAG: transcription termination/antitermination protein NusG [Lactobacillus sp.]|jgi:transcriptional antiterminator NusG|uniref:Transcription termination/antitermination protein NusG n=1 Tax=Lacticaseibacillus suilingensis TaxID=2799577 RepID=A0ABW4BEZ1_9LACO|nr:MULTISPECIES: transcription termination/antitermination protein NusG [Lacticaseibacillus]MCI1893668.1 transcription termination/antitermination protein NusG [Lactobacillus sp.]MCI1918197.1 transcription termination/antitermination protein NusG [Lactobacillus sp.]MCI1941303.1 transcription termination/antitermination protein NusG [Lactobacillus sp.]MCI1971847.1 transcription termination/antitermination protein NusG [Lactobacillus sp.]MCI2017922.1 transcription termination/antitermination pro
MVESAEKLWYVLHTYSGYENKVKTNLESRVSSMNMDDYIFRVIVPEEEEHDVKDGKDKVKMEKTFPGYVLVEMVMTDESWFVVRNTPGVTGFVGSHGAGSKPSPLMPDEVATILHSLGMSTTHANLSFEVGETITIIAGAFAGMKGKITANDPDKMKLKATINMFEREVSADLDYDQVDKL